MSKETLGCITEFADYLLNQDRSELTIKGYRADMEHFARWFDQTNGDALAPELVTPTDLREYRQYLTTVERRKANTVNRHLAAISAFLNWAQSIGKIDHNPAELVRSLPQTPGGPRYLNKKEQYALQRALERDMQLSRLRYPKRWVARQRDASMVLFLMHTGLRLHEALDQQMDDLQLSERKGLLLVRQGKGSKQRSIPLNSDARKAITDWLAIRPKGNSNFLWTAVESDPGTALSSRSVQRAIRRIGLDAGLEGLTPHVLRHTFAKNLVDSGVGLEKVAALLGHSSLNTTRVYITPNLQDLEKAVEQVSNKNI